MKTTAKYILTFLTCLMLATFFSAGVSAKTYSGSDGNISWSIDLNSAHMTVSGSGDMTDYVNYSDLSYSKLLPVVKTLVVENGITSVGDCAFMYAYNLESVSLPDSIKTIGQSAFEYCIKLKEINFPSGVTQIGNMAFSSCSVLESLVLPSSLYEIGEYAFSDCRSLKETNVPSGVTQIKNGTFTGCSALETVSGLENVEYIGNGAFYNCALLNLDSFPKNVTEVSPRAFFGCSTFDTLVPSTVLSPDGAFYSSSARFSVKWLIDGRVTHTEVAVNGVPSYNGTPKKNSVLDGIYTFASWNKELTPAVNTQNEYKAVFALSKPIVSASYTVSDGYVNAACVLDLEKVTAESVYILFVCYDESGNTICSKRTSPKQSDTSASASIFLKGRTVSSVKAYIYTDSSYLTPLGQPIAAVEL